jgi:hypothetical protein
MQQQQWQQSQTNDNSLPDYCICHTSIEDGRPMVLCESCDRWMHLSCVGMTQQQADATDDYKCPDCVQNVHAKTPSPQKPASPAVPLTKQAQIRFEPDLRDTQERIACMCTQSQPTVPLVQCDSCLVWQHQSCCGITKQQMERTKWFCDKCAAQQESLQQHDSPPIQHRSLNADHKPDQQSHQANDNTVAQTEASDAVAHDEQNGLDENGEVLYCKCRKPDQGDQGKSILHPFDKCKKIDKISHINKKRKLSSDSAVRINTGCLLCTNAGLSQCDCSADLLSLFVCVGFQFDDENAIDHNSFNARPRMVSIDCN